MSTATVIPDALKMLLAQRLGPQVVAPTDAPPPPIPMGAMSQSQPMSPLPVPQAPQVALQDPAVTATQNRTATDQARRQYLVNSGSGASQVGNPVDKTTGLPTGQPVSKLRRFGGALARIGDTALSIVSPGIAALTPGTELHHRLLINQNAGDLNNDLANQHEQAQTTLLDAQPELRQQALDNQALRNQNYSQHLSDVLDAQQDHNKQTYLTNLRDHGYTVDETDPSGQKTRPLRYEEMSGQQQAVEDLKHSQTELADANAALAKAKNDPSSPAFRLAQARVDVAKQNANTAIGKLSVARDNYNMHAFGKDSQGNELPGVLHDADGNAVGSTQAGNVKPTTQARDAAARAEDLTAIQGRVESALNDPEIQQYMGPIGGRLAEAQSQLGTLPAKVAQFQNDLVSYGAFQAGLHPVRGIGALQYFDKVMGGLHQTPEQLRGKLASNAATAGTVQQEGTMPTSAGNRRRSTAPNPPQSGAPGGAKPAGATGKVKGSDGRMYWTDAKGTNYGVAQ